MPNFRWWLPVVFLGLCVAFAPAQDDFSFHIEAIQIRGSVNVPRDLLLAEARLREGHIYRESALRAAQQRLNRLTFVLDSNISLEKGSERGKFVLVLTIEETENWFFDFDGALNNDLNDSAFVDNDNRLALGIGFRWFPGGADMLYAVLRPTHSNNADPATRVDASLGYAHYNLLDRSVFLNLQLDFKDEIDALTQFTGPYYRSVRRREAHVAGEMNLHIPLSSNKFWKTALSVDEQGLETNISNFPGFESESTNQFDRQRVSSFWEYNTVDDNLLPNRGTVFQVGGAWVHWDGGETYQRYAADVEADSVAAFVNYRRFHRVGARHYFSWGGGIEAGQQDFALTNVRNPDDLPVLRRNRDSDYRLYRLEGAYKFMLWGATQRSRLGDLWLEASGNLVFRDDIATTLFNVLPENGPTNLGLEDEDFQYYGLSLNYRGKWGVFRLGFLGEW